MTLCYMQKDRARFEQYEVAFFVRRNLPERLERKMGGLLHLFEGNQTHGLLVSARPLSQSARKAHNKKAMTVSRRLKFRCVKLGRTRPVSTSVQIAR